jgi:nicotinic acid mononucleotide adenylyltransferase
MILKRISVVVLFSFLSTLAYPWGKNGHRIIASICETYMSDSAKEEMYEIMGPDFIEELSTWPDYVRSEPG